MPPSGGCCRWCLFAHLCGLDLKTGGNLAVLGHPELEEVLDQLQELEEIRQKIGALERKGTRSWRTARARTSSAAAG